MGDQSGLDYICKVYDVSSSRVNIYKAICSYETETMIPLFEAIKEDVPISTSKSMIGVLHGKPDAVCDVIIDKISDNMYNNGIIEDLTEARQILIKLVTNLFYVAESDSINKRILSNIIK